MKTQALKQALDKCIIFDAAFGGARRDEEKSAPRSASSRSAPPTIAGTRKTSARNSGISTIPASPGREIRVFPLSNWTELDIWQYILPREASTSCRSISPRTAGRRARRR
jgi:sulfate adenylyltransferase subunit 2